MAPPYNPTGATLPALVYNRSTRVSGEFHLYYSLQPVNFLGSVGIDGNSAISIQQPDSCGAANVNPLSGFGVVRAKIALNAQVATTWLTNAVLPAYAPEGQAAEIGNIPASPLAGVTSTDTVPGDCVDVYVLPGPSTEVLICYDQGLTADIGQQNRAVPRKFNPVDHWVTQRPDNKISLKDIYCCNLKGLASLRNRDVTLIGKFFPNGGSIPSEIIYYGRVRLNIPLDIPDDSDADVMVAADGMFGEQFVFTALPTD